LGGKKRHIRFRAMAKITIGSHLNRKNKSWKTLENIFKVLGTYQSAVLCEANIL
jgi:predicted FMN-binding regulatory protein PaiB